MTKTKSSRITNNRTLMWNTSIIAEQMYCAFQAQLAVSRGLYAVLVQQHRAAFSLRRHQELCFEWRPIMRRTSKRSAAADNMT